MTQNSPKKLKVPAPPKVVDRKGVPQSMRGTPDARYRKFLAELFEVALKIADCKLGPVPGPEHQIGALALLPPKEHSAKFKRHWYKPFLATLAVNPKNQLVKIDIRLYQTKRLRNPKARIANRKRNKVGSKEVCACGGWFESNHTPDCVC